MIHCECGCGNFKTTEGIYAENDVKLLEREHLPDSEFYSGYSKKWVNPEFYSSFIEPRSPLTTIQMDLIGYTGTIKAQSAENYQSVWYNVTESTTYYNETRTIYMNIIGWHPLLRLCFLNSLFSTPIAPPGIPAIAYPVCENGQIIDVIIQNNGSGYLAPPLIQFLGDGSGATAEATIGPNGSIASINITNPGSGYWPIPNIGNSNAQPLPVSPKQNGAICLISTGYVTNLLYR